MYEICETTVYFLTEFVFGKIIYRFVKVASVFLETLCTYNTD